MLSRAWLGAVSRERRASCEKPWDTFRNRAWFELEPVSRSTLGGQKNCVGWHTEEAYVRGWRFIKCAGRQRIHTDGITFSNRRAALTALWVAADNYRGRTEFTIMFRALGVFRALCFELSFQFCYLLKEYFSWPLSC